MRYAPPSSLMASVWHFAKVLFKQPSPQLVRFNNSNFKILPIDQKIEEEVHDTTPKSRYYPLRVGEVIQNRYQIVGKLGYGISSTVWLANDIR